MDIGIRITFFFGKTWLVCNHLERIVYTSHSRPGATAEKKSFLTQLNFYFVWYDYKSLIPGKKLNPFFSPHPAHKILIRLTKVVSDSFSILRNYSSCFYSKRDRRYSVDFHSYFITPTYLICLSCVTPVPWRSNKIRNSFELASGWYVQVFRFSFRSSLRCILSTLNFHLCWRMIYTHISPSSPLFYSLTYSIYPLAIWLNP